ncbi:hypothetical protein DUNSADRAFT_166 [Dunaliella salina]|uniref:Encoded protein n=1 Tax=Dunaliella salina TaxID=3046 RepID=A0ABQ7FZF2_DUNSA|nr:hypothetical protein DUNSADRAFT_166 [Dunaliella salina]|eukprot:KAF5827733.1 hypothetical protein DUNSADRAFT_166 [Dunaliella salina]
MSAFPPNLSFQPSLPIVHLSLHSLPFQFFMNVCLPSLPFISTLPSSHSFVSAFPSFPILYKCLPSLPTFHFNHFPIVVYVYVPGGTACAWKSTSVYGACAPRPRRRHVWLFQV